MGGNKGPRGSHYCTRAGFGQGPGNHDGVPGDARALPLRARGSCSMLGASQGTRAWPAPMDVITKLGNSINRQ